MEGAVKGQRQQRPQRLGGEKGSLEWGCWAGECCGLGVQGSGEDGRVGINFMIGHTWIQTPNPFSQLFCDVRKAT